MKFKETKVGVKEKFAENKEKQENIEKDEL